MTWQACPSALSRPTRMRPTLMLAAGALLGLLAFPVVASAKPAATVLDVLSSEPRFSSLLLALKTNHLDSVLDRKTSEGVTLFAPDNKAFEERNEPGEDVDRDVLKYHILPSTVPLRQLADSRLLKTSLAGPLGGDQDGQRIKVSRGADGRTYVGDGEVVEGDLTADNGVIYVVDRLLSPPVDLVKTIAATEGVNVLSNSLRLSGFSDVLASKSPFTVFAPLDQAFDEIPPMTKQYLTSSYAKDDLRRILKYHTHEGGYYIAELPDGKTRLPTLAEGTHELMKPKNGGEVTYDGVPIQKADIIASNGAVHLIPRIFLPSSFKMDAMKYLIGLDRTKFVDFFLDAGLSDFLTNCSPESPVTIFTVPNEALEGSTPPSKDQMLYHVVPGRYEPESLQDNDLLRSAFKGKRLLGEHQVLEVAVWDNNGEREILINDAKVIGEPLILDGAIIYTISHLVELPVDPLQAIVADLDLSIFATAVETADLDRTIRKRESTTIFVPSNKAFFKNSALMSYLLLPGSEKDLMDVVRYHVATQVVYLSDFPTSGKAPNYLSIPTLVGQNMIATSDQNGDDLELHGTLPHKARLQTLPPRNRPTSNGNMFVIDHVLLPDIDITVRNLLKGLKAPTFDRLLSEYSSEDSDIPQLDSSRGEAFTLFVSSEEAFARVDMEELVRDPAHLTCSIKTQFVRGRLQLVDGGVSETLCADRWVKVHSVGDDEWELEVTDKSGNPIGSQNAARARIGRRGEARNGDLYEIDRFFSIPDPRGLAWYWILLLVLAVVSLVAATFALWRFMKIRKGRSGYQEVPSRD